MVALITWVNCSSQCQVARVRAVAAAAVRVQRVDTRTFVAAIRDSRAAGQFPAGVDELAPVELPAAVARVECPFEDAASARARAVAFAPAAAADYWHPSTASEAGCLAADCWSRAAVGAAASHPVAGACSPVVATACSCRSCCSFPRLADSTGVVGPFPVVASLGHPASSAVVDEPVQPSMLWAPVA